MNIKNWQYRGKINVSALKKIIKENEERLHEPRYTRYAESVHAVKKIADALKKTTVPQLKFENEKIIIGEEKNLASEQKQQLKHALQKMIPWRKGPFEIFGEPIDAEWRSDFKWQRVRKAVGSLQGKALLDIGCNNGYYLYLMAKQKPKFVLGIDPVIPYYLQFQFLQKLAPLPHADFKLLGVEDLIHFDKVFDVIFCMGILYHHPDPIGILRIIHQALRPGGILLIESQGINMPGPFCLLPKNRYLNMPGHWFLPTKDALENMIRRSGFQYVNYFYETKLTEEEQRKTLYAPYATLGDGMNTNDSNLTVEGYPAPWRFYLKAIKARIRR